MKVGKFAGRFGFTRILPLFYFFVLILSLLLTGLYVIFPGLTLCSSIFGETICTPAGVLIALIASLPGYLIVGNILSADSTVPVVLSFTLVIVVSILFYYLAGKLLDKLKKGKLTTEEIIKLLVFISFTALIFLLLVLL